MMMRREGGVMASSHMEFREWLHNTMGGSNHMLSTDIFLYLFNLFFRKEEDNIAGENKQGFSYAANSGPEWNYYNTIWKI